jgi:hypothetical protein
VDDIGPSVRRGGGRPRRPLLSWGSCCPGRAQRHERDLLVVDQVQHGGVSTQCVPAAVMGRDVLLAGRRRLLAVPPQRRCDHPRPVAQVRRPPPAPRTTPVLRRVHAGHPTIGRLSRSDAGRGRWSSRCRRIRGLGMTVEASCTVMRTRSPAARSSTLICVRACRTALVTSSETRVQRRPVRSDIPKSASASRTSAGRGDTGRQVGYGMSATP